METWTQVLVGSFIAIIGAALGSSGLWAYLQRRDTTRTQTDKLLLGLAYDKIVSIGMALIERGWVTKDEYEDYMNYFVSPYKALGGNGVTTRVISEVENLPLRSRAKYSRDILEKAKSRRTDDPAALADIDDHVLVE